jgi:hypothetical protein
MQIEIDNLFATVLDSVLGQDKPARTEADTIEDCAGASTVVQSSAQRMSLLPTAEFVAGNPTGWIYIESLAEALALRFTRLAVTALKEVAIKTSA